MQVSASIFKAYDVRGVVPSTLDEHVAEALGLAFGTVARQQGEGSVAVGRDGRLSGPSLSAALIRGLVAADIDVIDVGVVTTPSPWKVQPSRSPTWLSGNSTSAQNFPPSSRIESMVWRSMSACSGSFLRPSETLRSSCSTNCMSRSGGA